VAGVILLDHLPKFQGLPAHLRPSYHIINGDCFTNYASSSDLLIDCMKQNTRLQAATVPDPITVVQDLYRLVSFEWNHLISYYNRDLNSIEWALQHGDGNHKITPESLRDSMRNLFLSRRRIPWYCVLIRDQLSSSQAQGRRFWNLSGKNSGEQEETIAEELAGDFRQLEYLMTQIHERLDASMAHITGETNVLEAQRTHQLNQTTIQQNKITFAQNKILLALALVGTFFLPINAIAAVFSMSGQWAAGEGMFPVFWGISIPTALGLVSALLVFMFHGNRDLVKKDH
jgi:Mg2+ and Co2+ transporter CorA